MKNRELYGLILSNLVAMIILYFSKENILYVLWVYWGQSLLLGILSGFRIILTPAFRVEEGDSINANTRSGKITLTVLFFFLILFFHTVYALFIGYAIPVLFNPVHVSLSMVSLAIGGFLLFYLFSFIQSVKAPLVEIPSQGKFLNGFFTQFLPIHVTIISGIILFLIAKACGFDAYSNILTLILFQVMKTFAEILNMKFNNKT